jgi:hypothetical protein
MHITLVNATELSPSQVADWSALQRQVPVADSPFFSPEFTRLSAEMWNNVEVAVMQEGNAHIGFFPFERSREQIAKPVASVINDFHGVVAQHDPSWTVEQLLQDAGIKTFEFDHLPQVHSAFDGFMTVFARSPYIDLSEGFQKYCDDRRAAGSKTITRLRRRTTRSLASSSSGKQRPANEHQPLASQRCLGSKSLPNVCARRSS